jgi:hypothetical protein
MSLHAALATYTPHVRVCAGTNTHTKADEGGSTRQACQHTCLSIMPYAITPRHLQPYNKPARPAQYPRTEPLVVRALSCSRPHTPARIYLLAAASCVCVRFRAGCAPAPGERPPLRGRQRVWWPRTPAPSMSAPPQPPVASAIGGTLALCFMLQTHPGCTRLPVSTRTLRGCLIGEGQLNKELIPPCSSGRSPGVLAHPASPDRLAGGKALI